MPSPAGIGPHVGKVRVAVLCGCDAASEIVWRRDVPLLLMGNNDLPLLFDPRRYAWGRFHIAPRYFAQPRRWSFAGHDVILSMITDPDINPLTLSLAERVVDEQRLPVINHPASMWRTTREQVAERLHGIPDVVVPRVLRLRASDFPRLAAFAEGGEIAFPAIVRRAGTHTGNIVGRFERPEDCQHLAGSEHDEFYVTEYVDVRRPDGLFPKFRIYFIGNIIHVRNLFLGAHWSVHGEDYARVVIGNEKLEREEEDFLRAGLAAFPPPAQAALEAIRLRLAIDYCGMDGALTTDGRIVVFEINATMNYFPMSTKGHGLYKHDVCLPAAKDALARLILERAGRAWADADRDAPVRASPTAVRPAAVPEPPMPIH